MVKVLNADLTSTLTKKKNKIGTIYRRYPLKGPDLEGPHNQKEWGTPFKYNSVIGIYRYLSKFGRGEINT